MQQGVIKGQARLEAEIGERELRLFLHVLDPSFQSNMAKSFCIEWPNSYFMKASCVYFFRGGPPANVTIEYGQCGIGTENYNGTRTLTRNKVMRQSKATKGQKTRASKTKAEKKEPQ